MNLSFIWLNLGKLIIICKQRVISLFYSEQRKHYYDYGIEPLFLCSRKTNKDLIKPNIIPFKFEEYGHGWTSGLRSPTFDPKLKVAGVDCRPYSASVSRGQFSPGTPISSTNKVTATI